ncbi:hypothetical protein GCM10017714_26070 [Curtobacterium pusillum]|nr:hypothetical protein GCM10017610_30220 [Curtobacterium pusillum]
MSQQLWQDLFGLLVLGAGVLAGLGLISSGARARGQVRNQNHRSTRTEMVLISLGVLLMIAAFVIAGNKAFV